MSSSLTSMADILAADVPPYGNVPTTEHYLRSVKDAVADLSRRAALIKIATLAIVSGTASYDLPADFLRLIRLDTANGYGSNGVLYSAEGLVPLTPWSSQSCERTTIAHGAITFTPTPAYTLDRQLTYAAAYALDGDDYADLDDDLAQIALLKARAICLLLQAAKAARDAWVSELGPEKRDKTKQAPELRAEAAEFERHYLAALNARSGPYGSRS